MCDRIVPITFSYRTVRISPKFEFDLCCCCCWSTHSNQHQRQQTKKKERRIVSPKCRLVRMHRKWMVNMALPLAEYRKPRVNCCGFSVPGEGLRRSSLPPCPCPRPNDSPWYPHPGLFHLVQQPPAVAAAAVVLLLQCSETTTTTTTTRM